MKRDYQNILILCSVLFLLSFVSLVSAASVFEDLFGSGAPTIFGQWGTAGEVNLQIAKILLFIVVGIFIYTIVEFIPGIKKHKWLSAIVAIIVAFLGVSYFTPAEVYTIISTYSALGFILGVVLPFIVLIAFTAQAAFEPSDSALGYFIQKMFASLLWAGFSVFILYRMVSLPDSQVSGGSILPILQAGIIILSFLIAVGCFSGHVFKWLNKKAIENTSERAEHTERLAAAGIRHAADFEGGLSAG